jgi:hypothetical protein
MGVGVISLSYMGKLIYVGPTICLRARKARTIAGSITYALGSEQSRQIAS